MSQKDFVLIADVIANIQDTKARTIAAIALADRLPDANARFSRALFLEACSVPEPFELPQ